MGLNTLAFTNRGSKLLELKVFSAIRRIFRISLLVAVESIYGLVLMKLIFHSIVCIGVIDGQLKTGRHNHTKNGLTTYGGHI